MATFISVFLFFLGVVFGVRLLASVFAFIDNHRCRKPDRFRLFMDLGLNLALLALAAWLFGATYFPVFAVGLGVQVAVYLLSFFFFRFLFRPSPKLRDENRG